MRGRIRHMLCRWHLRIVLFVLLGAVVNIAVAWRIMASHGSWQDIWMFTPADDTRPLTMEEEQWYRANETKIAADLNAVRRKHIVTRHAVRAADQPMETGWRHTAYIEVFDDVWAIRPHWTRELNQAEEADPHGTLYSYLVHRFECGWPIRAMRIERWSNAPPERWELSLKWRQREYRLPGHVLWMGFVGNTLFYAVCVWLLFLIGRASWQALRQQRGLCAKCAYPVGERDICTECGHALQRQAV